MSDLAPEQGSDDFAPLTTRERALVAGWEAENKRLRERWDNCNTERREAWDEREELRAENKRLRELYENVVGNRERFGWTIDHLLECDEALRCAEAEAEGLRGEINGGWLALGIRRNPQHDVFIADGINRLRAMHAERLGADDDERQAVLDAINLYGDEILHKALDGIGWPQAHDGGEQ